MTSILKVNQIQDIGGNTIVSSDGSGGFTSNLPAQPQNAFRNIIINGDMSIAQRSTSVASVTTSDYRTCDRFKVDVETIGTYTISQSTDVPTGEGFATSLKIDCTTADASPASSDALIIRQLIEGQNLQYLRKGTASALSTTLSFWVKSTKTGDIQVNLRDLDNSRMISYTATINSANTWEKKTVTFAGDTTGALGNDNGASLQLEWFLDSGSDYSSGTFSSSWTSFSAANRNVNGTLDLADNTANDFYLTGVQLEAGTTASDFEFLPYDVNLQRCFRYAYKLGNIRLTKGRESDRSRDGTYVMPVEMRASVSVPSITTTAGRSISVFNQTNKSFVMNAVANSDGENADVTSQVVVSAEL